MSDSDVNSPSKKKNMASSDDEQVMGIPPQKKKKRYVGVYLDYPLQLMCMFLLTLHI